MAEAVHDRCVRLPYRRCGSRFDRRIPVEQVLQGDPGLRPRQRRSQAVVDAVSESHVVLQVSVEPEGVRFRPAVGVPVRRPEEDADTLAGRDDAARRQVCLLHRVPKEHLDRALVPHHLLDERFDERPIGLHPREQAGIVGQVVHHVPHQVRRRLVASHKQEDAEANGLPVREPPILRFGLDDRRDQVLGALFAALDSHPPEVLGHLPHVAQLGFRVALRIDEGEQRIGPALEPLIVLARDAQNARDHLHGQGHGVGGYEIELVRRQRVEEPVRSLFDPRLHLSDSPRRERPAHQLPETRMARWIIGDEDERRAATAMIGR